MSACRRRLGDSKLITLLYFGIPAHRNVIGNEYYFFQAIGVEVKYDDKLGEEGCTAYYQVSWTIFNDGNDTALKYGEYFPM